MGSMGPAAQTPGPAMETPPWHGARRNDLADVQPGPDGTWQAPTTPYLMEWLLVLVAA